MSALLVSLLIGVLVLVVLNYLLDAVNLEAKARGIIWIVAVILVVVYIVTGGNFLR